MLIILSIILLVVIIIPVLWFVFAYNGIIRLQNQVNAAWSDINVQLKRRHNLIPNLIESVKGYKEYEGDILKSVVALRQNAIKANSIEEKAAAESALGLGLGKIFAVAEHYPELKANEGFLDLQKNLSELEEYIQNARRYYNGTVRDYNTKIQSIPNNIIASFCKFNSREFFALDSDAEKEVPKVAF
ncbi:LemA family protein [Legionella massiliensis]|uniref:LemA family protein n=1 Tax=Legionella massiliensis TaxID=1034943 RepID=A0A078KYL2_9GAMM|nr:LemA family protein [Legionella massiliensis]CDZ76864.1 LemA family protein [Legionella massiliensis]CEE12602.1 LemA family protein [Legionella massiliensis]